MDISEICDDAAAGALGEDPESLLGLTRALAEMDGAEVEALIQRALHPSVPVGVLFAALDRYTALSWVEPAGPGRPGAVDLMPGEPAVSTDGAPDRQTTTPPLLGLPPIPSAADGTIF